MVQTRYAFGLYPATIVVLLNMMGVVGFGMLAGVISGQSVPLDPHMTWVSA